MSLYAHTILLSVSLFTILTLSSCAHQGPLSTDKGNESRPPKLKNAETKRIWIPDRIEGNRFEEGHWLYVIDKPVTWGKE